MTVKMKVCNAFLANHAETREGLAFISAAFPEWYTVPALPVNAPLAAIWVLEIEPAEIGLRFSFDLGVTDPGGIRRTVAHVVVGRSPDTPTVKGAPLYVVVTYVFLVDLQTEGLHTFDLFAEGHVMATMPLYVNLVARSASDEAKAADSVSG